MMKNLRLMFLCLFAISLYSCEQKHTKPLEGYDIVILNGRVMDPETDFDAVRNVGIKEGKIVTITEIDIVGEESIDATGLVVAPGFIDTHTHSNKKYNIRMALMDGVTTALDLEVGAMNIADWYKNEEGKWPINYGQTVSQEMARMIVMDGLTLSEPKDAGQFFGLRALSAEDDGVPDWSVTPSSEEQINQINEILDENLRQGALGIGSTVGYASTGISTYEMFSAQRIAANYGRLTAVHTRFHVQNQIPTEAPMGFDEIFTNASLLDAPLLVCHNNDYGWWEIEEKLALARDRGMNMWSEYYPYAAASTSIGSDGIKPAIIEDMLGLKYEESIFDPSQKKFLTKNEYLAIVKEDPGRAIVAFNPPRVGWMPKWLQTPHMTVASDAMWSEDPAHKWDSDPSEFSGHPRTSGSHSKALRMAREEGVPLLFTLKQLSFWSASHLGDAGLESMKARGRIQEGKVADITIFDPEQVKEGSNYEEGKSGLPPTGIPHVIVNGVIVKKDGQATNKFPGLPIRYPVQEKGRFEPIKENISEAMYPSKK